MKVSAKIAEKIPQICKDTKAAAEAVVSEKSQQVSEAKLPIMSLESVLPKKNIIRAALRGIKKPDIEKLIEEFSDINDEKTIKYICEQWVKDLEKGKKLLSEGKISDKKIRQAHQDFIKNLEKYNNFGEKVMNMTLDEAHAEKATEIFDTHIMPNIMLTQETMQTVDNVPRIARSYNNNYVGNELIGKKGSSKGFIHLKTFVRKLLKAN